MHPWLAVVCFFKLLFGGKLPAAAARFLPDRTGDAEPKAPPKALPAAAATAPTVPVVVSEARVEKPKVNTAQLHRDGALALLALLQREGRFVDFVRDSVDGASDADIGAAAREVHRGCRKVIDQNLALEPVMPGQEETKVSVPKGFDPAEVRLIGEAKGEAPFKGTLRHHGWRATEVKLPALADGVDRTIIAPAEVEL